MKTEDKEDKDNTTIITGLAIFHQIEITGISFSKTYLQREFIFIFFPLLCLLTYSGMRAKKSVILSAIEAIFAITMLGIVLGISSWFVNADDFNASREAIVLTGLVFFLGRFTSSTNQHRILGFSKRRRFRSR